jgi:ectoine hydroxylase-related dioxygenase (phytanoyl-CoA dioxygenase family)
VEHYNVNIAVLRTTLAERGFALIRQLFDEGELAQLVAEIAALPNSVAISQRADSRYGIRNLLSLSPRLRRLVAEPRVRALVEALLGRDARVVRSIFYDKTPQANWQVGWHQDTTIAVQKRLDAPGFRGWSVKAGVVHVQPPAEVLERVLTMRIHLDAAGATNGALAVIPGSHRGGFLSEDALDEWVRTQPQVLCSVSAGDVLLMRPLLVHASARARQQAHRRVVHLEWAAGELPSGLRWSRQSRGTHASSVQGLGR